MNESVSNAILLFSITTIAVIVWRLVSLRCPSATLPYTVYLVSYLFTTVIGATAFGVGFGLDILADINPTANLFVLSIKDPLVFWVMLFCPFIVPGMTILLLSHADMRVGDKFGRPPAWLLAPINWFRFNLFAGLLVFYSLFSFYRSGNLLILKEITSLQDDYGSMINLRIDLFGGMGMSVFSVIYVCIPSLVLVAVHRALITKSAYWIVGLVALGIFSLTLQLMTVQKTIAIIEILSLTVALFVLKRIKFFSLIAGISITLIFLTVTQNFFSIGWSIEDSLTLVLYRMAIGVVSYINIFPHTVEFLGPDMLLDIIGIGQGSLASQIVFDFIYPTVTGIQGSAPAPAHISAYAEGGVIYGCIILVIVGLAIRFNGALLKVAQENRGSSIVFAASVQTLVTIYYFTQVSLRDALISSYGLIWPYLTLFFLSFIARGTSRRVH
jgi:hypothetical protein